MHFRLLLLSKESERVNLNTALLNGMTAGSFLLYRRFSTSREPRRTGQSADPCIGGTNSFS